MKRRARGAKVLAWVLKCMTRKTHVNINKVISLNGHINSLTPCCYFTPHKVLTLKNSKFCTKSAFMSCMVFRSRSRWLRGLRRRYAVDCLLGLWVRTPPGTWMSISWECRVLSSTGLCEGADPSSRGVLLSVVCLCVTVLIVTPRRWGGLGPSWAVAPKTAKKNGVRYELNLIYKSVTLSLQRTVSCCCIKATIS